MFARDLSFLKKVGRLGYNIGSTLKYPWVRRAVFGSLTAGYVGYKGARGLYQGYNEATMTPEEMQAQAEGTGAMGPSPYIRRGQMPSNHLGAAGIGLSMSKLRHHGSL